MSFKYKVQFDSLEWVAPGDDVRYKIFQHNDVQLRLVEFGRHMKHPDWCMKGHFAYVLEGELELSFENQTEIYRAGDALHIPDGEAHKHRPRVLTDKALFFSVESVER